jgi:hypothetical protein
MLFELEIQMYFCLVLAVTISNVNRFRLIVTVFNLK